MVLLTSHTRSRARRRSPRCQSRAVSVSATVGPSRRRVRPAYDWRRRAFVATVVLSSRPSARSARLPLHAGLLVREVELTAQLGKLLAQPAVLLLVTGTQVVNPLVAVSLLTLGSCT